MRPSRRPVVIATRSSRLARSQAEAVARALRSIHPGVTIEVLGIESEGDRRSEARLSEIGGKGLFTRCVERALLDGRADIAVHSLKDMPIEMTQGLVIAAIPQRGDARDVLVGCGGVIEDLPNGAVVGTSSHRRAAQLLRIRGDLVIRPLRGNIETRLAKVDDGGDYTAALMAVAGLERVGYRERVVNPIDVDVMLPSAGQGALAIQCRADDHVTLRRCLGLNHSITSEAVHAERAVMKELEAGCHAPLAVYAEAVDDVTLRLRARALSVDGAKIIEAERTGLTRLSNVMVGEVYEELVEKGVRKLLREARVVGVKSGGASSAVL